MKVIMIAHCSHSYFLGEGEKDLKKLFMNDWYIKTAKQIKMYHPEIDVECWAPEKLDKNENMLLEGGLKIRFFPTTFSPAYALDFSMQMIKELKKEIKKSREEGYKLIIHIHEIHNLHGLLIASCFPRANIFVQHHGGSPPLIHLKRTKRYKLFFPFFLLGQLWENLALKNIKNFYALSDDEITYLKKVAPNSKVKFQTMGIEEEYFRSCKKEAARKKLGLNLTKNIILFVGRINDIKGVGLLLEAVKRVGNKNLELKIIGFGPQEAKFKEYAKKEKISNVEFVGGKFGEEKMLYLSAADALVLPSNKEGAPVVIMEALARNLPVVSTNVGGVSLMIKDGKNGLLIERNSSSLANAIKKILTWKDKNVKDYANKYKWKKIIGDTVRDYKTF